MIYIYLKFKFSLKENILVGSGDIGILQEVLQTTVNDVKESIDSYLIYIINIGLPCIRVCICLEQLQVLLKIEYRIKITSFTNIILSDSSQHYDHFPFRVLKEVAYAITGYKGYK